jgi:maltose O-acetyltransferase
MTARQNRVGPWLPQLRKRLWVDPRLAELRARWYLRGAESIGERPRVIGRPLITTPQLVIGDDFLIWSHYRKTHLGGEGRLEIGNRVFLNAGVVILAFERIVLEDGAGLASEVFVSDSDNHSLAGRPVRQQPITVGRGAWVGTRVVILAGVTIGSRAVVASGAVVTRDVPADTMVAGVPARPVRALEYPPGHISAWRGSQ